MSKLVDFVDSIVDNRGKNPPYYSVNYEYPVIDNFLINGERYPNINRVKRFIDKNIFDTFIRKYLKKDDVVITLVGNGVGSCCLVPADNWVIIQNTIGLKTKPSVYNRYLYYYLKLNKNRIALLDGGSSQPNVRVDNFLQIEVNFQNFDEQKKIAETLYILDSKIELNNCINAELEAMAKTVYDYWFVQFEFPIEAALAAKMGDPNLIGKPYKTSGGKMVWNEELKREIPEGWEVKELGKVLRTELGGTPSTKNKEFWNGDFPWLNSGEIANFPIIDSELKITEAGIKNSATTLMPKGTCVLSITRHLRPSILGVDSCANQSVVGIFESEKIKNSFIYPYLVNDIPRLMTLRSGAQQPHINKGTVDESKLIAPSDNVLDKYYSLVDSYYDKILNNTFQNKQLSELRDWLLPMLMNGQVKAA